MTDAHRRRFDAVVDWKFDTFRPLGLAPLAGLGNFSVMRPVSSALPSITP
jgi:hypothetical protein